ncbi:leucyl aminopeptidase [Auriculariales sp. MPI-PUGE-AT-0066]|nr:leucyl aminopeptidase [Auriculariales sp. MPI-PUGE-AT-0066]
MASIATHDDNRLPTCLKPLHYDLVLHTDLAAQVFSGIVSIDLQVNEDTSIVVLNAKDLDVAPASISDKASNRKLAQTSANYDSTKGRLAISFTEQLVKGSNVTLHVPFKAKLTDQMMGVSSTGHHHDTAHQICALTQCPTEARRAFPCWDEPLLKATFAITMISQPDTVNVSNMPATSEHTYPADGTESSAEATDLSSLFSELELAGRSYKVTAFETTPLMSSYLVAFANGDFKYTESAYKSPISGKTRPLRVYTTPDSVHLTQYALDVKARVLPIYEELFKIEYPLPKLDTLIVQNFAFGAMENWGLITGRSVIFLYDEAKSDIKAKKGVVETQSHECAHMWFGNIVTMEWWDNIWLNEARIYPEWKANSEFINDHLSRALSLDAKRSSHPIEVPIEDAATINQVDFDALSYSKVLSYIAFLTWLTQLLRMLVSVVGESKFLEGVSIYLKKHLYGNSITKDLWMGIEEATGFDVPTLMNNWVLKIGYPVLAVTETSFGITIRQDRFLDTGDATEAENGTIWNVPLQLRVTDASGKTSIDSSLILREREAKFALDTSTTWKLNADTNGVYRVAYTSERWAKIAQEIARPNSSFTPEDRMGLIDDVFSLAQAGYTKTSSALELLSGLRHESEYLVWQSATHSLDHLIRIWWEEFPEVDLLNKLRVTLYKPVVNRLGYEFRSTDSVDITQLRAHAIAQAANGGDPEVIEHLRSLYDKFVSTNEVASIPTDLLRTTLINAVRHGGETECEHAKSIVLAPGSMPTLKLGAIAAACSTRDQKLLEGVFILLREKAQGQDWNYFLSALGENSVSRRMAANFMIDNYDSLRARFEGTAMWNNLIKSSFVNLTTQADTDRIAAFFEHRDCSKFDMALKQSLDNIRASMMWLKHSQEDVSTWLKTHVSS